MWIKDLTITNVCSFENAVFAFSKSINILIGANNARKSSVLLPLLSLQEGLPSISRSDVSRETSAADFVDLKGKTISDFYMETLDFPESDPGAMRVVHLLDVIAQLPKFASLKEGAPMSFQSQ